MVWCGAPPQGKYLYLVRWQGYSDRENSWVPRDVRTSLRACGCWICIVRMCCPCAVLQHFIDRQLAKDYDEQVAAKKAMKRRALA